MNNAIGPSDPPLDPLAASPRIFANPVLDKFSRTHHLVPLFAYSPLVIASLWWSAGRMSWSAIAAAAIAGYLSWTILEYFGHRFFFHLHMPGEVGERVQFLVHGVHHDYPSDPSRLVMPPLMSLPILSISFLALRLLWGAEMVVPVFGGFLSGYVAYDTLHFHLHHGRSRTFLGRALRRCHMLHHFQDDSSWFGVSAPWWDMVFGTVPRATDKRSERWSGTGR